MQINTENFEPTLEFAIIFCYHRWISNDFVETINKYLITQETRVYSGVGQFLHEATFL